MNASLILFRHLKSDALRAADGESTGYQLSESEWEEALVALVEAVEAAHDFWMSGDDQASDRVSRAFGCFDFTGSSDDDTATQDPDTGAAQGGPAGQTGASTLPSRKCANCGATDDLMYGSVGGYDATVCREPSACYRRKRTRAAE